MPATQQIIDYGATANDGTGDPLRDAFIKTDQNFSNIWAAGPVGSNITITDNTIVVDDTNGNLILMPNGIGVIESRNSVIPRFNNVYNLGTADLKWNNIHATRIAAKDMTLSGNLTVAGDIIETGNTVTESLTLQLAALATSNVQANGAGIIIGANGNIATFLYDSDSNQWQTNILISTDSLAAADTTGSIQFNNDGKFAGSANLQYDDLTSTLTVGNIVNIGTNVSVTGANLQIAGTDSILVPVGNTDQRPGGVTGMVRFNTTLDTLEFYDSTNWVPAKTEFTVIANDQFNGDGTTTEFVLSQPTTTDNVIVSINGIIQIPINSYSVSYAVLIFTEAPSPLDIIDVRILTTTVSVGQLGSGSAKISADPMASQIDITGSLIPSANATANIGSTSKYFNRVYAVSTSAVYSDLAEMYAADAAYPPGTVLSFGGTAEVTESNVDADQRVAGVVSTAPSYLMNSTLSGDNVVALALTGRVPTRVTGSVSKGDMMVSNGDGRARAEKNPRMGTVIGKALANFNGADGVIEVVVGRL